MLPFRCRARRVQDAIVHWVVVLVSLVWLPSNVVFAQTEDLEPRVVGSAGTTAIGLSGFLDKRMSSAGALPLDVTAQVEMMRFLASRLAVRGGVIGSARFGGDDDAPESSDAQGLHARAGGLYYWTPQKMASLYTGGEYRVQVTDRADGDAGSVLGTAGFEALMSSRISVFAEGGWGVVLARDDSDRRRTRIVGEVGFRIRF